MSEAMKTTILLVDDNLNVLSFVQPALEQKGYRVTTAGDGLEALYQAETLAPALIVLDIEMPELNGLEVCRRLRERGDETPIIFLTVRDSVTDLELGFEFGADDYVAKPFDVRELLARIRARLPPPPCPIYIAAEFSRLQTIPTFCAPWAVPLPGRSRPGRRGVLPAWPHVLAKVPRYHLCALSRGYLP
jgi:CheY-like chemotaxis protein